MAVTETPSLPVGIPADRVRFRPPPGSATLADLVAANDRKQGICELVDGTLVEKPMGMRESRAAMDLVYFLQCWVRPRRLGRIAGPDGGIELTDGTVRMPDVTYSSAASLAAQSDPDAAYPQVVADLVVEVLSPSNTRAEIDAKRRQFFAAGTLLYWVADPRRQTVRVYADPANPDAFTEVGPDGTLDGGAVLPGFTLSVREWLGP